MSIEEDRNCNCNDNMDNNMMNNFNMTSNTNMMSNMNMMNTMPEMNNMQGRTTDDKALCLHRKYCREAKDLKDKYQKVYGPLTINFPCNKWRWLEEPWPWEGGMN